MPSEVTSPGRLRLDRDGATVVDARPPPARARSGFSLDAERSARLAWVVFVAYLVVCWLVLVFGFGSDRWFFRDDWEFLTGRDGGDLDGLLEAHGEHLSLLPIVAYRVLFNLVGLDFTVFLSVLVTLHLTAVALLRAVMRRVGVGPWVATITAGAFALYGSGEENIQWAFQIGFVGSVVYGLVHLVCADHDGGIDRRDWLGLAFGALAVLSSGIGPLMVVAVGGAVLLRRGIRAALFHTVPLAAAYGLWYVTYDPRSASAYGDPPLEAYWDWVRTGTAGVFEDLAQHPALAVALAAVLVVGLGVAWVPLSWSEFRRRAAAPLALLLASPLFFALTAQGRWLFGEEFARSSRYVYIGTVLVVPALGVAADALARRWVVATPVVLAPIVLGIPGNVAEFGESVFSPAYFREQRETMLGIAHSDLIEQVPGWVRFEPNVFNGPDLDAGWLLQARRDGRVPEPPELAPGRESQFVVKLGLAHVDEPFEGECDERLRPLDVQLDRGDRIAIETPVHVTLVDADHEEALPVRFDPSEGGRTLESQLDDLHVRVAAATGSYTFRVCAGAAAPARPADQADATS